MSEPAKLAIDAFSVGTVVGTIAGYLPALAALFSLIWTAIRIYETRTVQAALGRTKPGQRPECLACKVELQEE